MEAGARGVAAPGRRDRNASVVSRSQPSRPEQPLGPPDDPALHPERNEEDQLLVPEPGHPLAFQWDLPGRLRKLKDLVTAPQKLAAELSEVPDIFTPMILLTLLGVTFVLLYGGHLHPIILADTERALANAPERQLSAEQREGLPEAIATMVIWSIAAIGLNHIVLVGVYALIFYWLAKYLGFEPKGYPQWLSLAAFAWLPLPLYRLGLDWFLLTTRPYTSWNDLKFDAVHLYPGMHAFLPAHLPFDQYWAVAAFYMLGPIDLFLFIALAFLFVAMPYACDRPEPRLRLLLAFGVLLVIGLAAQLRNEITPDVLKNLDQRTQESLGAGGLPASPTRATP